MRCPDCKCFNYSFLEYCRRCGADLTRKNKAIYKDRGKGLKAVFGKGLYG